MTGPILQRFFVRSGWVKRVDEESKNTRFVSKLQLVQNAAVNTRVRITPFSAPLYWFLDCFRIDLNISMITFTAHFGFASVISQTW